MLDVIADSFGFHRSRIRLDESDRKLIIEKMMAQSRDSERVYDLLLLVFSNQHVMWTGLGELRRSIADLQERQGKVMSALDDLTTAIQNGQAIEQLAVTLLGQIDAHVLALEAELAEAGTPVDDSAALTALKDLVNGGAQKLADAINAAQGEGSVTPPAPADSTPPVDSPPAEPVDDAPVDGIPQTPDSGVGV